MVVLVSTTDSPQGPEPAESETNEKPRVTQEEEEKLQLDDNDASSSSGGSLEHPPVKKRRRSLRNTNVSFSFIEKE